jgi:hypothetical protein
MEKEKGAATRGRRTAELEKRMGEGEGSSNQREKDC